MSKQSQILSESGYAIIPQEDFVQLGKDLIYIMRIASELGCSQIETINASATFEKISEQLQNSIKS